MSNVDRNDLVEIISDAAEMYERSKIEQSVLGRTAIDTQAGLILSAARLINLAFPSKPQPSQPPRLILPPDYRSTE